MLFPFSELRSITTLELKSLFVMVNRIKYTPVASIVDYFKIVPKMSGPIECTSMVTRIAINLGCPEMANLAYKGDVLDLGHDHFVHAHILHEEPNRSLSMLYGHKAIWLPNPGLRLYSCKILTLQFDWMGEVRHIFEDHLALVSKLAWRQYSRPLLHRRLTEPQWDTGYGGGDMGYHEGSSYYPSQGYPEPSLRARTFASARYPDWYAPLEQYVSYGVD
jgi:hypothetical protein